MILLAKLAGTASLLLWYLLTAVLTTLRFVTLLQSRIKDQPLRDWAPDADQ